MDSDYSSEAPSRGRYLDVKAIMSSSTDARRITASRAAFEEYIRGRYPSLSKHWVTIAGRPVGALRCTSSATRRLTAPADYYKLFQLVMERGGDEAVRNTQTPTCCGTARRTLMLSVYWCGRMRLCAAQVTASKQWSYISRAMGFPASYNNGGYKLKANFIRFLRPIVEGAWYWQLHGRARR